MGLGCGGGGGGGVLVPPPPPCHGKLDVRCKGCGCRRVEAVYESRPIKEDSHVSSVGSVLPDCCDLVDELRVDGPHMEGEYVGGDDDEVVAVVVVVLGVVVRGDFLLGVGVVGVR